ncbi:MAG TPA: hypothetical protein ENK02_06585 [Planctomycetes bacterium]|nr:hypothetical protein [Planctomycetota bacterium]
MVLSSQEGRKDLSKGLWIRLVGVGGKSVPGPFSYRWWHPRVGKWSAWEKSSKPRAFVPDETLRGALVLEVKGPSVLRERGLPRWTGEREGSFALTKAPLLVLHPEPLRLRLLKGLKLEPELPRNLHILLFSFKAGFPNSGFSHLRTQDLRKLRSAGGAGGSKDGFGIVRDYGQFKDLVRQWARKERKSGGLPAPSKKDLAEGAPILPALWQRFLGEPFAAPFAGENRSAGKESWKDAKLWKPLPGLGFSLSLSPRVLLASARGEGMEVREEDSRISLRRKFVTLKPFSPGEERRLTLFFETQTRVHGKIPLPRAGIRVRLGCQIPDGWGIENVVETDAKGAFSIPCLPGKKYLKTVLSMGKDPVHLKFYCEEFQVAKGEDKEVHFRESYGGPYQLYFRVEDALVDKLLKDPKNSRYTRADFRPLLLVQRLFFDRKSIRDWTWVHLYPRLGVSYILEGVHPGSLVGSVYYPSGSFPKVFGPSPMGESMGFPLYHWPLFSLDFPEKVPGAFHVFQVRKKRKNPISQPKPVHVHLGWGGIRPETVMVGYLPLKNLKDLKTAEGMSRSGYTQDSLKPQNVLDLPAGSWAVFTSSHFWMQIASQFHGKRFSLPQPGEGGRGGFWGFLKLSYPKDAPGKHYDLVLRKGVFLLGKLEGRHKAPEDSPFVLLWVGGKGERILYDPYFTKDGDFFVSGFPPRGHFRVVFASGKAPPLKGSPPKLYAVGDYRNGARILRVRLPRQSAK